MVTVMYTCHGCGIKKRAVQVPARPTAEQDVRAWVEQVARCVADDHAKVSPRWCPRQVFDLYLPAPEEAEFLGQQIE